ncbi:hypothetical protein F2P56_020055 [Juglans regia]|uniref:Reverse transcriptase Ty1/copia-type domain-containing protein n=1 Tax=Juglans regia TaxID=51240 RepID=A0A833UT10_JUGRE|nr:hypothetical protein F2P56_020055 [Juglans regia]
MCATGTPLFSDEFTSYLLAGLNSDYDALVISITARLEPRAPEELYSLLLTFESRLAHSTHLPISTTLSANCSSGPPHYSNRGRGNYRGHCRDSPSTSTLNPFLPPPLPHSKPTCQVCGKVGHSAIKCFYRFDYAYQSDPPRNLTANYSSSCASPDQSWYLDTAATNHITSDMSNLNLTSGPYGGNEHIRIGDGTELPIANIGDSKISTPSHSFVLENLLHVLAIIKNLVSVQKLCLDTSVVFEFHSTHFLVKDSMTGAPLLCGPMRNGLYSFSNILPFATSAQTLIVYVDDIILTGSDPEAIQSVLHALNLSFTVKDIGSLRFFLGLEIQSLETGLHLS